MSNARAALEIVDGFAAEAVAWHKSSRDSSMVKESVVSMTDWRLAQLQRNLHNMKILKSATDPEALLLINVDAQLRCVNLLCVPVKPCRNAPHILGRCFERIVASL